MRTLAVFTILFAFAVAKEVFFCDVPTQVDDDLTEEKIRLGSSSYTYDNFNLVSFGDYTGNTGDIEGRGLVRNSVTVGNGYSFGYELRTGGIGAPDRSLPYSLIAGGDVTWVDGALYPDGSNFPYTAAKENALVGGTFTAPSYLKSRQSGSASTVQDDLDAAKIYFTKISAAYASMTPNIIANVPWDASIFIECTSSADSNWVVNIDGAVVNKLTDWNIGASCSAASTFVFNIGGNGQVNFNGGFPQGRAEKIVFNILGSGRTVNINTRIDASFLAPNNKIGQLTGVVVGLIVVGDIANVQQINRVTCTPTPTQVVAPCVSFEKTCAGLDLSLSGSTFSFKDFNAISFGDFNAKTGDVEGRLAVRNNAVIGEGYSIGAVLSTFNNRPDNSLPYSFIVGKDATWGSGELYPLGNNFLAKGKKEDMYVGGTFSSSAANLVERRVGGPGSNLESAFDAAKSCYQTYSDDMANQADSVSKTIKFTGMFLTCSDSAASDYTVSITDSEFASFTYFVLDNCNFQARWVINVRGTGDVDITGDTFPAIPGGVVYNVIGSRNINIHDTRLGGHLLAPTSTLTQGGVIIGKVVVGSVASSQQINSMNTCPLEVDVTRKILAADNFAAGVFTIKVYGASDMRVNDMTTLGRIEAINGDYVTFSSKTPSAGADGTQVGSYTLKSTAGRAQYPNNEMSSASVAGVALASLFAAALVL